MVTVQTSKRKGAQPIYLQIANRINRLSYNGLSALAQQIHDELDTNAATFTAPPVILADLQTAIDDFNAAIQEAGIKGNKGSHASIIAVRGLRDALRVILIQEAKYVLSVVRTDAGRFNAQSAILLSSGMRAKKGSTSQATPGQIRNLRQSTQATPLVDGGRSAKIMWDKPRVSPRGQSAKILGFKVYKQSIEDPQKVLVTTVTKTSALVADTASNPGGRNNIFSVVAFNSQGDGPISTLLTVNFF